MKLLTTFFLRQQQVNLHADYTHMRTGARNKGNFQHTVIAETKDRGGPV